MNNASHHSIERMKERAGICERQAERRIRQAFRRGKGFEFFASWERRYLQNEGGFNKAIAFNGFCYIFGADGICITLFPLPIWFGKKKRFDGKVKVRDAKKYFNSYGNCRFETE